MTVNLKLLTAQIAGMFVVFALILFLAAGTAAWPAGWAFLVLFFGFTIALSRWLLGHNPGLLTERMTGIGKSDGPYRYVRHPMYATAIIFLVGTTLWLGSWYALISGLMLVVAIAGRAVQEERTLRAELPGYDEYMAQVNYRLIPYVW